MLSAVIAAFLYLRIIVEMFFEADDDREPRPIAIPLGVRLTLAACLIVTIGVGLVPGPLNDWAAEAEPELVDFPESSASPDVPTSIDDDTPRSDSRRPGRAPVCASPCDPCHGHTHRTVEFIDRRTEPGSVRPRASAEGRRQRVGVRCERRDVGDPMAASRARSSPMS